MHMESTIQLYKQKPKQCESGFRILLCLSFVPPLLSGCPHICFALPSSVQLWCWLIAHETSSHNPASLTLLHSGQNGRTVAPTFHFKTLQLRRYFHIYFALIYIYIFYICYLNIFYIYVIFIYYFYIFFYSNCLFVFIIPFSSIASDIFKYQPIVIRYIDHFDHCTLSLSLVPCHGPLQTLCCKLHAFLERACNGISVGYRAQKSLIRTVVSVDNTHSTSSIAAVKFCKLSKDSKNASDGEGQRSE